MTMTRPDGKMPAGYTGGYSKKHNILRHRMGVKPDTIHSSRATAQDTSGIEYHTVLQPASAVKNK